MSGPNLELSSKVILSMVLAMVDGRAPYLERLEQARDLLRMTLASIDTMVESAGQ